MNNEKIIEGYRLKLVNLHLSTIYVVSFLEVVSYLIMHAGSTVIITGNLMFQVVIPIILNFTTHFVVRGISRSKRIKAEIKNASVIYGALVTACVLSFFHMSLITTACSFAFPIVLSAMFCDKKLLNKTLMVTMFSLAFLTIISCAKNNPDIEFWLNQIVIYGINIISYLSALLTIDFTQSNLTIISNQLSANRHLWHSMRRDQMTGIYNHITFFSEFEETVKNPKNADKTFCLAMIDIDDFKKINDKYGHDDGDKVLIRLANIIKACITGEDKPFRYGGEEFVVLFVGKSIDRARTMTENMLASFSNSQYDFSKMKTTFSAGIVSFGPESNVDEVFAAADDLMYKAKRSGKNRIEI